MIGGANICTAITQQAKIWANPYFFQHANKHYPSLKAYMHDQKYL